MKAKESKFFHLPAILNEVVLWFMRTAIKYYYIVYEKKNVQTNYKKSIQHKLLYISPVGNVLSDKKYLMPLNEKNSKIRKKHAYQRKNKIKIQ